MRKLSVLFVDDESRILDGLRVRLHRQRSKWDMLFALSGKEALELLAARPIDVIVSDMRMPEMDGATLLRAVQQRYPGVVRIVLSGHSEEESAMRALPVTHQFLHKPCEPGLLENVVDRATQLQRLLGQDCLRTVLGRIERLPSPPRLYQRMCQTLQDDHSSAHAVAEILRLDMAMCAKVLQLVNSAFFGLARAISEPEDAVTYLGFETLRQVVLAAEVFQSGCSLGRPAQHLEDLQHHAVLVARLASSMFTTKAARDEAFVAGLLHDIGKLVLCCHIPERMQEAESLTAQSDQPLYRVEESLSGISHAEVGAYLLGLWGLPYPIVEATAYHHHPQRVPAREFGTLAATYVADHLVHAGSSQLGLPSANLDQRGLDMEYLSMLGVAASIDVWRQRALDIAARDEAPV